MRCDLVERLVPTDGRELAAALRAGTTKRCEHAIRAVHTLEISVDLYAEMPTGNRMRAVRSDLDGPAIGVDRDHCAACIRTIVRACHSNLTLSHCATSGS